MSAVVAEAQATLAHHGRSFRQAQVFLPADQAADAAVVYALCRLADDLADEGDDVAASRAALDDLSAQLRGEAPPSALVTAFLDVLQRRGAPVEPALALVGTVRADLEPVRLADDQALLAYAWGVAGTVGLLMAPVLGAPGREAAEPAAALGVAMQITNICRDVREDAERGRVYLPEARLRAAGVAPDELLASRAPREAVARVVLDLLDLADTWYERARAGYPFLPWRARLCVAVAGALYRRIGQRLRRVHGGDPLGGRTVVPLGERVLAALQAVLGLARRPEARA